MNFGLLLLKLSPLFIYVIVDYWKGFKAGILAAIISATFVMGWDYWSTGEVDAFTIGETALIVLLGAISLKMNNERFFKFQPTVIAMVIVSVFAYFELKHESLLVRYIPQMEKIFAGGGEPSGEVKVFVDNLHSPQFKKELASLSKVMIFVFLAHGLIMAYAAVYWSTARWLAWRLAIYPALLVAVIFVKANS